MTSRMARRLGAARPHPEGAAAVDLEAAAGSQASRRRRLGSAADTLRTVRHAIVCAVACSLSMIGCGSSVTSRARDPAGGQVGLRRALIAAYKRPVLGFAHGDPTEFCAAFTRAVQQMLAHRRGVSSCAKGIEPAVRGLRARGNAKGLGEIIRSFDAGLRDAHREGSRASIKTDAGPTRRVIHFQLVAGRWLISDTPHVRRKSIHSHTPSSGLSSVQSSWFTY